MLKVTKVQPIATHRDYTKKNRGNFQEIYCETQKNCGILCAQDGDYRAAEEIAQRCKVSVNAESLQMKGLKDHRNLRGTLDGRQGYRESVRV